MLTVGVGIVGHSTLYTTAAASLRCDRTPPKQINCKLRRYNLLGVSQTLRVFDPYSAAIESTVGRRRGRRYQVQISTPLGKIPLLVQKVSDKRSSEQVTTQINDFLLSSRSALSVQQNARQEQLLYSLLGLAAIAGGTWFATAPITLCSFYKRVMDKVVIERKSWRSNQVIECAIDQIQQVEIQDRRTRYGKAYRPVLILKSQDHVPIHPEFVKEQNARNVVYSIQQFLADE